MIDPGVRVSMLMTNGPSPAAALLEAAEGGAAVLLISPLLEAELREVVSRAKFRQWFSAEDGASFADSLVLLADPAEDPSRRSWKPTCRDPDDEYLVVLASVQRATALASGDKGVLAVELPGISVLTPRQAVEALA